MVRVVNHILWRGALFGNASILKCSETEMATGGGHVWASPAPSSHSDRIEEPSRKYSVVKLFFDRLVKEAGPNLRVLVDKLREKGAITPQQRENVVKTLRQQHLKDDYAPSLLFEIVLRSVEKDDINFDRLLLALRELKLGDLADELHSASVPTPPHVHLQQDDQEMEHDNAHFDNDPLTDQPMINTSSKKIGEEMSIFDSGIIAPQSLTLPNSSSASSSNDSNMFIHHGQPEIVVNQPRLDIATADQEYTPPLQESHSEVETLVSSSTNEEHSDIDVPMGQPNNLDASLTSHPQLQEPAEVDEVGDQQAPIQVDNEQSNTLLLVPSASYTSFVEEASGTSSNEELVDQLSQRLIRMRLELQNKERELQARAQEMQQSSELLLRCQGLEKQVKKMEEEVQVQKRRTDRVSSDKDKEISSWKRKCEEKEREIQELHATIAQHEQDKDTLTKIHIAELAKLQEQKKESTQKVADYEIKVAALNDALRESTLKKEEAEQQLKLADSKMHEAVAERHRVENELLRSMIEKEKELSRLKDANHKLELEISNLRRKNQSLAMDKKDQEVLLSQKDRELAEHKLAEAEEKHDCCARELRDQRRMSEHLQDENHNLKRQLSELQERYSVFESPAKRSKTD